MWILSAFQVIFRLFCKFKQVAFPTHLNFPFPLLLPLSSDLFPATYSLITQLIEYYFHYYNVKNYFFQKSSFN